MANVVMVTGAWHGGWSWRAVAERLRAAGHTVFTPTLPGLADGDDPSKFALADTGKFVAEFVEKRNLTDVTLVGHSWGGYVITDASHHLAKRLKKIVYWSAFVPAKDRSLFDEVPPPYQGLFAQLAEAGKGGVALPLEVWKQAFMNDAEPKVQETIHALMVPSRSSTSRTRSSRSTRRSRAPISSVATISHYRRANSVGTALRSASA